MAEHVPYQDITIETIDTAIRDWFDKTVDAHVINPNKARFKVPVIFSSGERWVLSKARKGLRDGNGVLILPVISVRRTGIEPDPSMIALGTETPTITVAKQISGKTNNLANLDQARQVSQRIGDRVVYEVTSIPFPDRSIFTYDLTIHTQYMEQMNTVLQKVFHELDLQKSFVAPFINDHRHPQIGVPFEERKPLTSTYVCGYFETTLADGGNLEEFTDSERIIKYQTSFKVPANLRLDPEGEIPSIIVKKSAYDIKFNDENVKFVDDRAELDEIFGTGKPRIKR